MNQQETDTLLRVMEKTRSTATGLMPDAPLESFDAQAESCVHRLLTIRAAILNAISYLEKTTERDALTCFYAEGLTIPETARAMHYSQKQVKRLKAAGIRNLVDLAERGIIRCL